MKGPEPAAALRGFLAVVRDMARVDPGRRPSAAMQRWHRDIGAQVGVLPPVAGTASELLESALLLQRQLAGGAGGPVSTERAA